MTNKTLIQTLQEMANAPAATIEKYVATQALAYGENPEEFLKMVVNYGCNTGVVGSMIYYADTHTFFDTYYEEIEELRIEYENSTGIPVNIQDSDLKNTLAWFAFDQVAYQIANKLELDF